MVQSGVGVDEEESRVTNLTAIPNPTEGITSLTFENASTGIGHVQLYSMDGRIVHDKTVNLINGMNQVVLDYGKLDSGIYNLQLTSQGGISATRLVIK